MNCYAIQSAAEEWVIDENDERAARRKVDCGCDEGDKKVKEQARDRGSPPAFECRSAEGTTCDELQHFSRDRPRSLSSVEVAARSKTPEISPAIATTPKIVIGIAPQTVSTSLLHSGAMNVQPDDLRKLYAQMPEEELLLLARSIDTLTGGAQVDLKAEFVRRDVLLPEIEVPGQLEYRPLITVRRYRDPSEAMVAKTVLESAGIESYLRDENTVRIYWGVSNSLGGIRLQVDGEDFPAAAELLDQSIPASIAVESEEDFRQPHCPRCGSLDVGFEGLNQKAGMASMFLFSLPVVLVKNAWKCHRCRAEWQEVPDEEAP